MLSCDPISEILVLFASQSVDVDKDSDQNLDLCLIRQNELFSGIFTYGISTKIWCAGSWSYADNS